MTLADDLNLKTTIKISGKELTLELLTIGREKIIEIKLDGNIYSLDGDTTLFASPDADETKQTPDALKKTTEQIASTAEISKKTVDHPKKTPSTEIRDKAPNHTTLFINWLEGWKETKFDVSDFIKRYSYISKEQATKIAEYQVKQGILDQMSHTRFRIIKRDAENGTKK